MSRAFSTKYVEKHLQGVGNLVLVHSGDFVIEFAVRKDFRIFFLGFAEGDGFVVVFENRFERFDMIGMSDWRRGGLSLSFVFSFL